MIILLLFTVYAILDGIYSGTGIWFLFLPQENRKILLREINGFGLAYKIWLLAGTIALFIAFPGLYNTIIGSFYPAVILIIGSIVFRFFAAVLRNSARNRYWITIWDIVFTLGSIIPPIVFGIAAGNILKGLPLDRDGNYLGTFPRLFSHYSIAAGLTGAIMFATQSSLYLAYRSEEIIRKRAIEWARFTWILYLIFFIDLTVWSISVSPYISVNFKQHGALFSIPLLGVFSIVSIPLLLRNGRIITAFLSSTLSIVFMLAILGISLFPTFIPASGFKPNSLTIYNTSSPEKTLLIMLVITAFILPLMLFYTFKTILIKHRKAK